MSKQLVYIYKMYVSTNTVPSKSEVVRYQTYMYKNDVENDTK